MNNPYFSIVIPTYNRENFILKTIKSIENQTFQDFEIIIVDDGSTDNTEEIIKSILSDRIHYYKKENGERAAARNFGTKKAIGKYINWFDSDDLMKYDHLRKTYDYLNKKDSCKFLATGYSIEDLQGIIYNTSRYSENMNSKIHYGNFFACSPVFIQKEFALLNPFNTDRLLSGSEDYELWLRLACQTKIHTINSQTVTILQHDERSVLTMVKEEVLIERFMRFLNYSLDNKDIIKLLGNNKSYFVARNYLFLAVDLASNGHKKSGWKYLRKAFTRSPKSIMDKVFFGTLKHLCFGK